MSKKYDPSAENDALKAGEKAAYKAGKAAGGGGGDGLWAAILAALTVGAVLLGLFAVSLLYQNYLIITGQPIPPTPSHPTAWLELALLALIVALAVAGAVGMVVSVRAWPAVFLLTSALLCMGWMALAGGL